MSNLSSQEGPKGRRNWVWIWMMKKPVEATGLQNMRTKTTENQLETKIFAASAGIIMIHLNLQFSRNIDSIATWFSKEQIEFTQKFLNKYKHAV